MVYKVYYQQDKAEVAVRERTQSMYVEAGSEREVRFKVKDQPFNIEFIQPVEGAFYDYEKQNNQDFKVLELG